jgi:CheY-like chemotaxis protein
LPDIARLDGLRVLVVDDDADAVALAEAILTGAGAGVRTSLGASEALHVLRQWRPDVLDIEMPGVDGCSFRVPKPVDPGELTAIIASVAARPR